MRVDLVASPGEEAPSLISVFRDAVRRFGSRGYAMIFQRQNWHCGNISVIFVLFVLFVSCLAVCTLRCCRSLWMWQLHGAGSEPWRVQLSGSRRQAETGQDGRRSEVDQESIGNCAAEQHLKDSLQHLERRKLSWKASWAFLKYLKINSSNSPEFSLSLTSTPQECPSVLLSLSWGDPGSKSFGSWARRGRMRGAELQELQELQYNLHQTSSKKSAKCSKFSKGDGMISEWILNGHMFWVNFSTGRPDFEWHVLASIQVWDGILKLMKSLCFCKSFEMLKMLKSGGQQVGNEECIPASWACL